MRGSSIVMVVTEYKTRAMINTTPFGCFSTRGLQSACQSGMTSSSGLAHSFSFSTQTTIIARTSAMNTSRWVSRDLDALSVYHPVRSEQGAEAGDDARPEISDPWYETHRGSVKRYLESEAVKPHIYEDWKVT